MLPIRAFIPLLGEADKRARARVPSDAQRREGAQRCALAACASAARQRSGLGRTGPVCGLVLTSVAQIGTGVEFAIKAKAHAFLADVDPDLLEAEAGASSTRTTTGSRVRCCPGPSLYACHMPASKRALCALSQVGGAQPEPVPGLWHAPGDARPLPTEVLILSLLVAFREQDDLTLNEWCMLVLNDAQRYDQARCTFAFAMGCMQSAGAVSIR